MNSAWNALGEEAAAESTRLILWSNDVLHRLVGDGFANQQHPAAFLWWAEDQPGDDNRQRVDGGA